VAVDVTVSTGVGAAGRGVGVDGCVENAVAVAGTQVGVAAGACTRQDKTASAIRASAVAGHVRVLNLPPVCLSILKRVIRRRS